MILDHRGVRLRQEINVMRKQTYLAAVSDLHLDQDSNRLRDVLWSCEEYVESGVDHLILGGDLVSRIPFRRGFTKKGSSVLFAKAKQDLKAYGFYNSLSTSIVPGNHDLNLLGILREQISATGFLKHFKKLHESAMVTECYYPWVKLIGPVALIGIDSTSKSLGATGYIGNRQIQKISDILDRTDMRMRCPVLILHHSPLKRFKKRLKRLRDSEQFLKAIRGRVSVVLCGHTHAHGAYREQGVRVIHCSKDVIALLRIEGKDKIHLSFRSVRYEYT